MRRWSFLAKWHQWEEIKLNLVWRDDGSEHIVYKVRAKKQNARGTCNDRKRESREQELMRKVMGNGKTVMNRKEQRDDDKNNKIVYLINT